MLNPVFHWTLTFLGVDVCVCVYVCVYIRLVSALFARLYRDM